MLWLIHENGQDFNSINPLAFKNIYKWHNLLVYVSNKSILLLNFAVWRQLTILWFINKLLYDYLFSPTSIGQKLIRYVHCLAG